MGWSITGRLTNTTTIDRAMTDETTATPAAISMRTVRHDDGSYGVELTVTGLASEEQAEAAMQYMQRLFCGQEISKQ